MANVDVDVAIIGGGPAGSTAGTFLRKYGDLRVAIFEREVFPRDHVGESQLPEISRILHEMGCWDKVEAANFPIKIGATYKWGKSQELWDFDFMPTPFIRDEPRPAKFEGQRRHLAFQVDRAVYDKILLDHSAELGCQVREGVGVRRIATDGDSVNGLELSTGETVTAKYYLDCSGHAGILRRAVGVATHSPTSLQNIAIWDYWQNADWAEEIGVGGTRVQVMSVGYGWIWFIPLGPERTSVGLIVPAEYYRQSGERPEDLYAKALAEEPRVAGLMANAVSEGNLQTTKDWSFLAERHSGANWMLVGESSGFADPILAAGMTITHVSGREAAFSILEAERGEDWNWLREAYDRRQTSRIRNHIRFADYWYSANEQFVDLQEHTRRIAAENGLDLEPGKAWAWLAQGGFIDEELTAGVAGFALPLVRSLGKHMGSTASDSPIYTSTVFELDIEGAERKDGASYREGHVHRQSVFQRGKKVVPVEFPYRFWIETLPKCPRSSVLKEALRAELQKIDDEQLRGNTYHALMAALEALIADGWVRCRLDPSLPLFNRMPIFETVHWHE
ncbi:MAG: hypothetical protein GC165_20605 [Armatimonadetes bacterium]|nr:hypothetical protein [Armatimonadota bacterium]